MSKVKVLFFAADPSSALPESESPRLLLDEDVRHIRQNVRAADFRDRLEFDVHWAARTDDLLQALNENPPQVVHFSGHGGSAGLVLVGTDGEPHPVDAEALAQLFEVFRGDIRLVVLNACFSLPQAEAIAQAVGCAIGTRGEISDEAAITFGASFYRAVAFGHSVKAAFDQARTALALEHVDDRECPVLVVRPGVDPARLVLIPRPRAAPEADACPRPAGSHPLEPKVLARRWLVPAGAALVLGAGTAVVVEFATRPHFAAQEPSPLLRGAPADSTGPVIVPVQRADTLPPAAVFGLTQADTAAPSARKLTVRGGSAEGDLAMARELYGARNYAAAYPLFLAAADAGIPEAMGYLGIMYLEGQGTQRRTEVAVQWLVRAAAAGDGRGMNALGVACERGAGVERNYREAMRWYQAAQEAGYAQAMGNIGTLYRQGWGVEQSYAQALHWYRKGAVAGSADAMLNAGTMYEHGLGTPRDVEQALRWYRSAADAGSMLAMVRLGMMYLNGSGTAGDARQARTWFYKAAEAGSADGMYNMGVLYYNGRGVPRSRVEAIRWFQRAAGAGSTEAAATLDALDAG